MRDGIHEAIGEKWDMYKVLGEKWDIYSDV